MVTRCKIWCTTFCNHGHSMRTGRPVGHECYVIPPKCLRLEYDTMVTDPDPALIAQCKKAWGEWAQGPRTIVNGRMRK